METFPSCDDQLWFMENEGDDDEWGQMMMMMMIGGRGKSFLFLERRC